MSTVRRYLAWIDSAVYIVSAGAAAIAAALLLAIFVTIQYEVVMRFVFNRPTFWVNESTTYAISWVGFLAAGYVLRIGRQLEIDVVTMRLTEGARRRLGIVTDLIGGVFCTYTAYLGYEFSRTAYLMRATSASELDVPLWMPYLAIPIGFAILAAEFYMRAVARWVPIRDQEVDRSHAVFD